jgi:hypothetical protein
LRLAALIVGLALYAAALFAPAIVFKPDVRSNPKHGECGFAVKADVMCESFAFGGGGSTICQRGGVPGKTFVDKGKILDYCKGWDAPAAGALRGYEVLAMGVLGVLLGMFAWFANPLMLAAVLLAAFGKRRAAMVLSVLAAALGLQSYALDGIPFNESSTGPDNLNIVDHLGLGFYLWMASLLAFAAYCFQRR